MRGRALSLAFSVLAIALMLGAVPAHSQMFQIGKISVCTNRIETKTDECKELAPPFNDLSRRLFPNKRIDLKFTILGEQEALSYLNTNNYLPVRAGVWRDGIRKDGDIAADINESDWDENGKKLISEFSQDGQFEWRTFFHVNLNNASSISIEIDDASQETVSSGGRPARLSFAFAN